MDRQIKFRALDDGKMVYEKDIAHILLENSDVLRLAKFFCNVRNDSKIMLYTGLKDLNSKEVYEGDIVKYQCFSNWDDDTEGLKRHTGVVGFQQSTYSKGCFDIKMIEEGRNSAFNHMSQVEPIHKTSPMWGLEVIGNIHQNPELLK